MRPFGDVHFLAQNTCKRIINVIYLELEGDKMSRLSRSYSESGVYHILFRGVNQQNIFEEKEDYKKLADVISEVKAEMNFEVYAYCFMTNHVHLVIKESKIKDISLIMKRILTKYARWYNLKYRRSGALIANRYKSVPVEIDEYFLHLIRYVHQNPIKAGITGDIEEYPYSSYNEYTTSPKLCDTGFVLAMTSIKDFIEFHETEEELKFNVTDRIKKTDEDMKFTIKKKYGIDDPKEISKLEKDKRNEILCELKKDHSARQIQRITDVPRGLIAKL